MNLDVVGFEAILIEQGFIVRHEGEAVDMTCERERCIALGRGGEVDATAVEAALMVAGGVAERAVAQAVLADAADVDIGGEQDRAIGEAIRLRDLGAEFVDGELAIPRGVGGALTIAGGGVDVAARGAG